MGQYEFLVNYMPRYVWINRTSVSNVTTQMGDAYYVYRRHTQQTHDNFRTTAADNMWFVALVTNRRDNVQKFIEKCFSYCSNPFETINMKIEQNIAYLMIRGSPN